MRLFYSQIATKWSGALILALVAFSAFNVGTKDLQASVLMSMIDKLDGTVELTYSGFINTTGLVQIGTIPTPSSIQPSSGLIQNASSTNLFLISSGSGSQPFGTGGSASATSSSGSAIYANFGGPTFIGLPVGYVSGGAISGSMTFSGSFASLGINPVARTFSWSAGGLGNSVSLSFSSGGGGGAVPEPTSLAIFGIGVLGMAYRARRKSKI
ncbi:MAG: PEP-CTERM sorting domain-containing protein [Pirellulaceae bacterium]